MEPAVDETPADELTMRSVDERIKQGTDPILRRVEELCALLASRTEMESLVTANRPVQGAIVNPLALRATVMTHQFQDFCRIVQSAINALKLRRSYLSNGLNMSASIWIDIFNDNCPYRKVLAFTLCLLKGLSKYCFYYFFGQNSSKKNRNTSNYFLEAKLQSSDNYAWYSVTITILIFSYYQNSNKNEMNRDILEIDLRKADLTSAIQPTMKKMKNVNIWNKNESNLHRQKISKVNIWTEKTSRLASETKHLP